MIAMGLAPLSANVLKQVANVAAQGLARHLAPATATFGQGLAGGVLYSEADLILPARFDASDPAAGLASQPLVIGCSPRCTATTRIAACSVLGNRSCRDRAA